MVIGHTHRNVPSHLPVTMARVERAVAARRSRLPRCRSSPSTSVQSPQASTSRRRHAGCTSKRQRSTRRRRSNVHVQPLIHNATAPPMQSAKVVPMRRTRITSVHKVGRDRCHSRQSTGLRSSDGPGNHCATRPIQPPRGPLLFSIEPRHATGRIRQTAMAVSTTDVASVHRKTRDNPRHRVCRGRCTGRTRYKKDWSTAPTRQTVQPTRPSTTCTRSARKEFRE